MEYTLYVGGLAPYTTAEQVLPIFEHLQEDVERCRIAGKIHAAFVTFTSEDAMLRALEVTGEIYDLDGQEIKIEIQKPQESIRGSDSTKTRVSRSDPEHTVYVGNLEPHTTRDDILPFLEPHGEVIKCRIVGRIHAAFVTFSSADDVQCMLEAAAQPGGNVWNERELMVQIAGTADDDEEKPARPARQPRQASERQPRHPRATNGSEFTLYVGGLAPYTEADDVLEIFGDMKDEVLHCRIAGRVHAAFVTFSSEADMLNALAVTQQEGGCQLGDQTLVCEIQSASGGQERAERPERTARPARAKPVRTEYEHTLYVGDLAPYTSEEQVLPLFGDVQVENCRIAGRIHAAFVSFGSEQDMLRALETTQLPGGNLIDGRELRVEVQKQAE